MTWFDTERAMAANAKVMHGMKYGFPLPPWGALAALQVVVGNLSLQDAANSVGVSTDALVREAEAWAVAQALTDD
jgi:hypothetical protein